MPIIGNCDTTKGKHMNTLSCFAGSLAMALLTVVPAAAEWTPGNAEVTRASKDERVAAALSALNGIDRAATGTDPGAFTAFLADDLAVNNPRNGVSIRTATAQRSAAGRISYSRYDRIVEYAGLRNGMVLLMGEEIVVPRDASQGQAAVNRRFTDLWKEVGGTWKLTARQATIIARP